MNHISTIATISILLCCVHFSMADDEVKPKERMHFIDARYVYAKSREIRIVPFPESPAACRCPDGTHSSWRVWHETDKSFHVLDRACGGMVDKSDVYTQEELDAIDLPNRKPDEISWIRLVIAESTAIHHRFEESIDQCDSIVDREPKNATALMVRAYAKIGIQAYDSALLDISLAEDIDKRPYEISYLRGFILMEKGRYEEALFQLAIAYSKTPHRQEIALLNALCNMALGRTDDALRSFAEIHLFDPRLHCKALRYRSELLIDQDKPEYDAAIEDYEYIRTNSEEYLTHSLINLAYIHSARSDSESRNPTKALEFLELAMKSPNHSLYEMNYRMAKCLAYMASEQYDKADQEMKMLKRMYAGVSDYIEFEQIEQSLKDRVKFIHKKEFPLCR